MTHIEWTPTPQALRKWAWVMLAATGGAGCVMSLMAGRLYPAFAIWGIGLVAFGGGIVKTSVSLPIYRGWMGFVWVVSWVLGSVAMALVFFLVVTPMGLVARMCGRDRLVLRRPGPGSLWQPVTAVRRNGFDRPF
jgi:hypothetical protein